jgi:hypothetical protein
VRLAIANTCSQAARSTSSRVKNFLASVLPAEFHPTSGLSGKTEVQVTPASVHCPRDHQRPERIITTGQKNAKNALVNKACGKGMNKNKPK